MANTCLSLAALFLPFLLLRCATAAVHVVGDSTGWRIPDNAQFYTTWVSDKTFRLNDTLSFQFATGQHDVVKVPKASYDSCSENSNTLKVTTGPYNYTLNETGSHYFICSFGQHCQGGQKLAVVVSDASSPTSSPSPTSSTPQPPPPPSSAASRAFAGFIFIVASVALGNLIL
ncbi:cucumber peeling cupredoxin-like [Prosopis cineraria]|uniref:cucumber peeling cupredoxin-like n=1 Tax=Prosopis cineraria TaxID=364024 RepID=UPI0024109F49|nr:cucumber peeling cupredoxin-like [Prosopis cineraria]